MRIRNTIFFIVISALLVVSSMLLPSCGQKKVEEEEGGIPVAGIVTQATGEFDLFGLTSNCWVSGAIGTAILNGDRIKVGPNSLITVILASGTRFSAHENSFFQITFSDKGEDRIALTRGEVWVSAEGAKAPLEVFSSTVQVLPNEKSAPGNSLSVLVEPGGHTIVDVYEGSASVENESGIVKAGSPGRYEASEGLAPSIVDAEHNLGGAPDGNNGMFVEMQISPFFSDEGKRDEIEEEALAQVEAGSQEPWSYAALAQIWVDRAEYEKAYEMLNLVLSADPYYESALLARGKVELLHSKWREALETYSSAKRSATSPVEALFGMAQAYLGMGDLDSAKKWYKEMLNSEPEEIRALAGLGIVKLLQLELDGASMDFNQALEAKPDYVPANIGLAMAELLQGNGRSAEIHLEKVVEKDPKYYEAWTSLGLLEFELGRLSSAEASFRRLEGSEDSRYMSVGYQNHGALDWVSGKVDRALEKWTKAWDLEKERYPVKVNMGLAYLSLESYGGAREIFTGLSSANPFDWYSNHLLAVTSFLSESYFNALAESIAAFDANGLDWPSKLIRGMSLVEIGESNAGERDARRSRADTGDWMPAAFDHFLLGFSYEQEKDYDRALAEYREASELFPSDGYYHYRAGIVLAARGDDDEAMEEFKLALESNYPCLTASIGIAGIKAGNGDLDGAVQEIESAIGRDKNNVELRKAAAEFFVEQEEYDDAANQLQQARGIEGLAPDVVADLLILEGNVHDKEKDYAEALSLYEEAIGLDPSRGDAWYYFGVDLEKNGDMERALQAYQQAYVLCAQKPEWAEFESKVVQKLTVPPNQ